MKITRILLPLTLTTLAVGGLSGCKASVKVGGSNCIQIRAYNGGYGVDWLHAAADAFRTIHPEITFEFVEESSLVGESTVQEIVTPKKNNIDLYFITGLDVDLLINKSYKALKTRSQVLLEPLNDVYESKAIGLDGKEEEETIKSRFFEGFDIASQYDGSYSKWKGSMFTLPWANAMTGLFVNPSVLEKYEIEIPLTSNEFITAIHKIYDANVAKYGNQRSKYENYPFSWSGDNAPGYWSYLYETWFAQYSGKKSFNNFVNCDPGDGTIKENGYKVYEDPGILKSLQAMFEICDLNYSVDGSASQKHMDSQTDFVTGKSAFMIDGDWVINEMKRDYFEYGQNIKMIGAPILSAIGEEIGISDAQLHTLVEMIDAHKSHAEIIAAIPGLDDAKIDRVYNARCVYDSIGGAHGMAVPSYADAKDAVKLFMRFFYSNDGCRIFRNNTYTNLPIKYQIQEGDTNTVYQQSLDKIQDYDNPQMVTTASPFNNVRSVAQIFLFNVQAWSHPVTFKSIMLDKASASPAFSAEYIYTEEAKYVKTNWNKYMTFTTWL